MSYRGQAIWNNFLSTTDKKTTDVAKFFITKTTFIKERNKLFLISDICTLIRIYSVYQINLNVETIGCGV